MSDASALEKAFLIWKHFNPFQKNDSFILPFLLENLPSHPQGQPPQGWLKLAREAQHLSGETVARRLFITKQSYQWLEKSEIEATITIGAFQKAAEALDCELILALRPKDKRTFSKKIWQTLLPNAVELYVKRTRRRNFRPLILANIAKGLYLNPRFRKKKGWFRNQPPVELDLSSFHY